MTNVDNERLAARGRTFNMHETYDQLVKPIEDQLIRAVWGITQNPEDAEEALQEALEGIWRKLDRIERHPNPRALMLRIAINAGYDVLRRRARRLRRQALAELITRPKPAAPDDLLARKEQESVILRAIARLSRNQSEAVMMRLVQHQSYGEIAEVLGCSAATARKHVERGRQKLRSILAHLAPHRKEAGTP
jgi:RNA polymerase sigma factor (sigma-70 family)